MRGNLTQYGGRGVAGNPTLSDIIRHYPMSETSETSETHWKVGVPLTVCFSLPFSVILKIPI
jgi:hypothetical protein